MVLVQKSYHLRVMIGVKSAGRTAALQQWFRAKSCLTFMHCGVGRETEGVFALFRLMTWLEGWRLSWMGFGLGSEGVRLLRERAPEKLMVR